jgi:hypothetical protein
LGLKAVNGWGGLFAANGEGGAVGISCCLRPVRVVCCILGVVRLCVRVGLCFSVCVDWGHVDAYMQAWRTCGAHSYGPYACRKT